MKKVLITGATGFVGSHLIQHLAALGDYDVCGTSRSEVSPRGGGQFLKVDLLDKAAVQQVLREVQPEWIVHLAAQANVPQSIKDPVGTFHTNIDSELNLFQSLLDEKLTKTKILLVSSGEVYGQIKPEDLPVKEDTQLRPANPYAVSKIAQDYLGFQYHLSYKLPIIRVRPFNHIGPGQKTGFVVSDFAKQIAEIEKGTQEPVMKVGNLEAKRDFTDVRDMVKLYPLLLEKGTPGEVYNAGSGVSRSAQEILDVFLSNSSVSVQVVSDPDRKRPSDIPEIKADITKVTAVTGWKPEIPFEQTLKDTLEYWRGKV